MPVVDIEISVPEESRKLSSFFVIRSSFFQDQAPTALWINNHPPIQDQAPTALEESVLRSSFIVLPRSSPNGPYTNNHPPIQDQAPMALGLTTHRSSRSSPKALEDPLITIRSNPPSKIKPMALEETSNSSSKIKPRRPLDQRNIHKSTPYADREDQNRERL
ncbi:hypothetical protein ACFX13_025195 [Malus domestica]